MIRLYLGNGEKALNEMDENQFDLAIVDPPYGIGNKFKGGKSGKMNFNNIVEKGWDVIPNKEYFKELFRISNNQIIWGGNYFNLPPTRCFIVWDKKIPEDFTLAMAELAWTSFDKLAKIYKPYFKRTTKIHPTQKPVKLYKWLLKNYGFNKDGTKRTILDTHSGSLSIGIACADLGFDLDAWEIDQDYFQAAVKRLHNHVNQLNAFVPVPEIEVNGEPLNEYMKQLTR